MNSRIAYLDYLKTTVIFFVIIYHCKAYDKVLMKP